VEELKITLYFDRSTKNKHLFKKAEGSSEGLDNIYLNKDSVKGDVPQTIEVTISG
tara:strand:+ start:2503 stop:2667 length:165 start_codon:yes stop_codon:yes gene_type:complete